MSSPEDAWSVHRLAKTLKSRVEDGFQPTWVRGELVGVKRYPSGHWYFGLRDDLAKVDCMIWRSVASKLSAPLEEGAEIFALGTPGVWEERTALRFSVTRVVPAAEIGAQARQLEITRKALLADGLLDPARKRPLPEFPKRIAIITSLAGAAVHDVITVAENRWPGIELVVIGSSVQGDQAPGELVAALSTLNRLESVDCCIIGRGGGGKDDLAAFNDEAVCRAIAACRVPVVSAVGHEVDVTIADLVADLRAATPSQAAEFVLPDRREVVARVKQLESSLTSRTTSRLTLRRERLHRTLERMGGALLSRLRSTERRLHASHASLPGALERHVREPRERFAAVAARLKPAIVRHTDRTESRIGLLAASLDALSPVAVLGRGYSLARNQDGRLLRRRADFVTGERFDLTLTDGDISARVEGS